MQLDSAVDLVKVDPIKWICSFHTQVCLLKWPRFTLFHIGHGFILILGVFDPPLHNYSLNKENKMKLNIHIKIGILQSSPP